MGSGNSDLKEKMSDMRSDLSAANDRHHQAMEMMMNRMDKRERDHEAERKADAKKHEQEIERLKDDMEDRRIKDQLERERTNQQFLDLVREMKDSQNSEEKERLKAELEQNRAEAVAQARRFEEFMETNKEQIAILRSGMERKDAELLRIQTEHAKQMEEYKKENAETLERLAETIQTLKDENAQFVYDPEDPDKYNRLEKENFNKLCAAAAKHIVDVPKLKKHSLAVLGPSGTGKSTIINAFAGKTATAVGLTECTDNISMVYGEGEYDFYDVPGSHDARADFFRVDNLLKIASVHLVMVIYETRIDHAAKVAQLMVNIKVPFIVVRNKCNFAASSAEEWADAKRKEAKKLETYTSQKDLPLVYLGYLDEKAVKQEGARMDNFNELEDMVKRQFA